MTTRHFLLRTTQVFYVVGALAIIPAVLSFAFAAWSAATTGEVMVIRIGFYSLDREYVPWYQGWARFVSPLVIGLSLLIHRNTADTSSTRLLVFVGLAASGIGMLAISLWFTSLSGVAFFYAFFGYIGFAFYIDEVFGRKLVVAFLVTTIGILLYFYMQSNPSFKPTRSGLRPPHAA